MSKIEFNAYSQIPQAEPKKAVLREQQAALFDLRSAMPGGEVRLDAVAEQALGVILREYDGNAALTVPGDIALFPEHVQAGLNEIFMNLKQTGMLAGFSLEMSRWSAVLTPDGLGYFDSKQKTLRGEAGYRRLPSNSEKLLRELADSDAPAHMLRMRFEKSNYDEYRELSGVLRELVSEGYIRVPVWKDDIPQFIEIDDAARAYFDLENEVLALALKTPPDEKDGLKRFDLFLCHAGRDRSIYTDELYNSLSRLGIGIRYDKTLLSWGDNWKEKILEGAAASEFSILVISENIFDGEWTEKELSRFLRRKNPGGQKVILPLLHKITVDDLYKKFPSLSDIECLTTDRSNEEISILFARELIKRLKNFSVK